MGIFKNINIMTGQRAGGLPGEFFQRPAAMTGRFAHFEGEYPKSGAAHVCKSYWKTPVYQGSNGQRVKGVKKVQYDCWRHVYSKAGKDLYCPACWYDRVKGYCRQIEKISLDYLDLGCLAYVKMTEGEYIKARSKITTNNSRNETAVNYTTFPVEGGRYLLHDAPAWLGGESLPSDRNELYNLLETWSETPKGKRAGHGLGSWGNQGQGKPGKGQGGGKDEKRDKIVGYVMGSHYTNLARFLAENVTGIKQGPKGMRFDEIDLSDFLGILEENGIDYDFEGDVTVSRGKNKEPLLTVTNGNQERHEGGKSEGENEYIPLLL